jgi:hypothetical protein
MNVIIRGALIALGLITGAAQMANAAGSVVQQPDATQPVSSDTRTAQMDRPYSGQISGVNDRTRAAPMRTPGHNSTIQSGNDFNFMQGGGG